MLMKNNNKHVQSCFLTIAREKECACKMGGYKNAEAFSIVLLIIVIIDVQIYI